LESTSNELSIPVSKAISNIEIKNSELGADGMAEFLYQGVDSAGVAVSGHVDAVDRRGAIVSLNSRGCFPTSLEQKDSAGTDEDVESSKPIARDVISIGKINSKDILALTGQLHTALQAGLPIMQCLEVIEKQMTKPAVKKLLGQLSIDVNSGDSLSESMAKHKDVFSKLYLAMIRVGETAGILEQTTGQLTDLLKREDKVKSDMKSASAYPLFVLTVGFLSVVILVTMVLPNVIESILENTAVLPLPTRMLMWLSDLFGSYYSLVFAVVLVAGVFVFKRWVNGPNGRLLWDTFKLKIPVLGNVLRTIAVGRFARTLGSLSKGGITILEALGVVRDTMGNEFLARQIDDVTQKVKAGEPLAEPLARSGDFPPLLVQIVSVGEQTGKLDLMLLNAAATFDEQADAAIKRFTSILPAVLVMLLAVVVGFIVAATLMAVMSMDLGAGM